MLRIILFCILIIGSVLGLDEKSAKELRCPKTPPTTFKNFDLNWAENVGTWYFTHGNRLGFYRIASDVSEIPISEMKEDYLYYHSCLTVIWKKGKHPIVHGFHGKKSQITLDVVNDDGDVRYTMSNHKKSGVTGDSILTLTDNKTFQFYYDCYDDGEASWMVMSTVKDLDKKTEKIIHDHARSLGFNDKYFTEMEYETCKNKKSGDKKSEL